MPLLYEIPMQLQTMIGSQQASLVGAMIKDNASGLILGHVQQASGLAPMLGQALGAVGSSGFSPLGMLSVAQNEGIRRGVAELQNGMILMQNLQYGTLALSGLGLGVSIAGFAATLARLKAIEARLEAISAAVDQVTTDRREDELKSVFAEISGDIQNVETLSHRRDPQRVAEQLQLSLARSTRKIEHYFLREADLSQRTSLPIEQLDRLWTLAAAIRLCQEASIQALFAADELEVAQRMGQFELERQIALLQVLSPDILSRLVSRGEPDPETTRNLRQTALGQARALTDGIKGGVLAIAGQISIASTLREEGMTGIDYVRRIGSETNEPLVCLVPRT